MLVGNERFFCDHSVCCRLRVGMIRLLYQEKKKTLTLPSALKVNSIHRLCWGPALGTRQNGWKEGHFLCLDAEIKICAVTSLSDMKT